MTPPADEIADSSASSVTSSKWRGKESSPDSSLLTSAMAINQVRRLRVLDDEDLLVRIVSMGNLSREDAIGSDDTGKVMKSVSGPGESGRCR